VRVLGSINHVLPSLGSQASPFQRQNRLTRTNIRLVSELGDDGPGILINPGHADIVETVGELGLHIVACECIPADLTCERHRQTPDIGEAAHLIIVRGLSWFVVGNAPRHLS